MTQPESVVKAFLDAVNARDVETLKTLVSPKATGPLAKARTGELDERGIGQMAEKYGHLGVLSVAKPTSPTKRLVVIGPSQSGNEKSNKDKKQIELLKDGADWKVVKIPS